LADTPAEPGGWRAYWLYRGGFALGRRLPRPVGAALAAGIARVLAGRSSPKRDLLAGHLARVFGHELPAADRDDLVRAGYASYAQYWLDSTRATGASQRELEARTSSSGFGNLEVAVAAGRGAILALPHLGSWDYGGAWIATTGYPLTVVAEMVRPARLFEWFAAMRRGMDIDVIPLGPGAATAVGTALRAGRVVALVSDRDIGGNGVEVEFFGEVTRLPAGPATLAFRTGAALLPAAVFVRPGGRFHATIRPPIPVERSGRGLREDVRAVTQVLAREMEDMIRAAPEQWHMFQPNWPSDPGYPS
jgi:lauroyl/myristoyl acyltransferase